MQTIQASILIQKYGVKNFRHVCIAPNQSYTLSKWDVNINDELFRVKEISGAYREGCLWQNVTFQDVSSGGSVETFGSKQALINRLIAVGYNAFYDGAQVVIGDLISDDGSNALVLGTDGKLFVPSSGGGGSSTWHNQFSTYSGSAITVHSGFSGSIINMDFPQGEVTYTLAGADITITGGATSGDRLHIFGIY